MNTGRRSYRVSNHIFDNIKCNLSLKNGKSLGILTACIENGQYNVRVNALAPGPVDNRMMRSLEEQLNPSDPEALRQNIISQMIPMQKYSTNEDIANLALFLGSDESANCSGAVFLSDGGFTAA